MTIPEMIEKIKGSAKMAKSVHLFGANSKSDKALLVLYRFNDVTDDNRDKMLAGIELSKDQIRKLIRDLTIKYRQMERADVEKGENE